MAQELSESVAQAKMTPPNVLLLTLDTVRWDSFGCYGSRTSTPCIDELAASGTLFEQAVTNGTYTKTAFPPILSSTYASQHGGPFAEGPTPRPMAARTFQEAGYRTAAATANPLLGAHLGYDAGFDAYYEAVPPREKRSWLKLKGMQGILRQPLLNSLLMKAGLDTLPHPVYVSGDTISDWAIEWLESTPTPSPFFLWLHYMDAHWPYHSMESLRDGPSRSNAWRDLHTMWESRGHHPGAEVINRIRDLYSLSINRLDSELGRVLAKLHETDVFSNTIVVITSDHGEAFHEHGRWQHGAVFDFHEEVIHVPLVVAGPGVPRGLRVPELVGLIDIAPTMLDLAGLSIPSEMVGSSLRHAFEGDSGDTTMVISEMLDLDWYCVALRTETFKYIYDERRPSDRLLFDLAADPTERQNLYGQSTGVELELEAQLQKHLERVRIHGSRDDRGAWQADDETVQRLRDLGYIE